MDGASFPESTCDAATGLDSGEPFSEIDGQVDHGGDREELALPVLHRFKPELRASQETLSGARRMRPWSRRPWLYSASPPRAWTTNEAAKSRRNARLRECE